MKLKITNRPAVADWKKLIQRKSIQLKELNKLVKEIFVDVKENGDSAVIKYTNNFDKINSKDFCITKTEIKKGISKVPTQLKKAIEIARGNIEKFHLKQIEKNFVVETMPGVTCWRENRAIEKVGIYIPGGTAPLFSTILMLGIPAVLAGCKEIILCTPPDKKGEINPAILYTANLLGIQKIFKVGGIQAISAMTFGTNTVPNVYKIFGPGNQYVNTAKQMAQNFGVAIDLPAGPSELLIIADHSCIPSFVAADLLSQAEHGADSQVILLSTEKSILESCIKEIIKQIKNLPRKSIAKKALKNSKFILLSSINDCVDFSNLYAPEHLILAVENSEYCMKKIKNAGSVFIGNYSCESAGDYASGTNHTLPTNGYAKNYSGVSMDSFVKKITFQKLSEKGILNIGPAIELMAEAEQLIGHKNAVSIRMEYLQNKQ